ncbi:MAG: alpha/beta fold hydrolase [Chloroflexia bacterium]|nr:alpha/beta fold hydrolase [Chloroflexia bacterium]
MNLPAFGSIFIKSTSENPLEPVFYLEGGPGMTNQGFWPADKLLEQHDVVLIGYRGVDGTAKLSCPEFMKGTSDSSLFSKASIKVMQNNIKKALERWKQEGLDINCYTMTDVIDDLEIARMALGYSEIDLLSVSYGTRLAQIYSWRYPKSIKRSILVSVNPPGHFVWLPKTIDNQIKYYSRLWENDSVYGKKTKDLAGTIKHVIHNMPEKWLFLILIRTK